MLETERLRGVQEHEVQVAGQTAVLEGVVQHDRLAAKEADRLVGRGHTVGIPERWPTCGNSARSSRASSFPSFPCRAPYPRLTIATEIPRSRSHRAIHRTSGVLPVPAEGQVSHADHGDGDAMDRRAWPRS